MLTLLGLRGRRPEMIASLPAFGYLVAGAGPLPFGFAAMVAVAIPTSVPRYVDDELEVTRR